MDRNIREVAEGAARAAADVLMHYLGSAEISHKGTETQNLVTQADVQAEAVILERIAEAFPDHHVLGEEGGPTADLDAPHLWVVDPLDGTTNFAHGIPQFAVSIAYVTGRQIQCGVVYDPSRDELFAAERAGGATMNGREIRVSRRQQLSEAVIATGFYYDRGDMMRRTLKAIERLFAQNVRGIRRLGSAALDLSWVACGRLDGFFEYQLSPWDYAAAALIIDEAGGRCADRDGRPLELESGSVIVSNGALFEKLTPLVRWQP